MYGADRADRLADGFRRIGAGPAPFAPAVQVELRVAALEGLPEVGREAFGDAAERGAAVAFRMAGDQVVQRHGIGPHGVADIGKALEPALDLERAGAGFGEVFQAVEEVEIPQRQQGLVADEDLAGGVREVIAGPAGLDAGAAVGAASVDILREITVPAVTDAEGAVDETFDLAADGLADGADLIERQLPLRHEAGEAEPFEEGGPFRGPDGALRRRVQGQGKVLAELQQGEILDDQGIDARPGEGMDQRPRLLQFLII